MKDRYDREINYMRISITDRCNLRCRYCMPEGIARLPMEELLTYKEILSVCREAVALGITKFKITGGEPLVRKGCENLIRELVGLCGVEQVTMTTNGMLLQDHLDALVKAGLRAVNISLDTLDPACFQAITGFPGLEQVLASIDAAVERGLQVKVNTLLQPGINGGEWPAFVRLAKERPLDVRFIEMMPIGYGRTCGMISNERLLQWIRQEYPRIEPEEKKHGNGPAVYYKIPGFKGSIGFISAIHGKFCGSCNRIRMTSTGELKPCLCYRSGLSVREAARSQDRERIRQIVKQAIRMKPDMHCFEAKENITELREMARIGG